MKQVGHIGTINSTVDLSTHYKIEFLTINFLSIACINSTIIICSSFYQPIKSILVANK